ncbi:MAG: TlyA family RNA methyltransferase [Eubacteriales bacterium]|nr:TlyA family RNA methyltransferase [Eubacteriales bacterium]
MKKERLDILLVQKGYFESRQQAKSAVMEGNVFVDGEISDKVGTKISLDSVIEVRSNGCPYVSRGGYKLEESIRAFSLDLNGKVCLDMGASTGGFTDCMLQHGASKVYSVDVGYGQLAWKLRQDSRVVNIERCNVRYMKPETIGEPVDFVSIDVSFISLRHMFPVAKAVLKENGEIVCLIKPQFEAGREEMKGTKGIVRDPLIHEKTIRSVLEYAKENGLSPKGLTNSPVKGTKGNIEFLLYLKKEAVQPDFPALDSTVQQVVQTAHQTLDKK